MRGDPIFDPQPTGPVLRPIRRMFIGVLFGWFAYKIEGPGLEWGYSIYQGHLFFQKATYAHVVLPGDASGGLFWCSLLKDSCGMSNLGLCRFCG